MAKYNIKNRKRTRNLIFVVALSAIVLSVSTYAWFIGMRTVNVQSFDVEIAGTDSLWLSFDGQNWGSTVKFDEATLENIETNYSTNTNAWTTAGLIPMSTVGEMDNSASRLKLFEKASLTTTAGGYRLLASRVDNYTAGTPEQDGYVAFDLFIRNFSGTQYISDLEEADEEAIYLTTDSAVTVSTAGGQDGTGIENSVRVAFAQIGRVIGTTADVARANGTGQAAAVSLIQGITCTTAGDVTGICRNAQIWEPNDTDHNENAIRWYSTSCRERVSGGSVASSSYDKTKNCNEVVNGQAYPTYAVRKPITSQDAVDVYDGTAYNNFNGTIASSLTVATEQTGSNLLYAYNYFTDTMKLRRGTARPTFMTLAPNSVTKVRVYVFIEGPDIENYDFASIGKKISVKFGFTKERFNEDDIDYDGPNINQGDGPSADSDTTAPVITLTGDSTVTIAKGTAYTDAGAFAYDRVLQGDGTYENVDLTSQMTISGIVNVEKVGTYRVTYKVKDSAGNETSKSRTVIVTE